MSKNVKIYRIVTDSKFQFGMLKTNQSEKLTQLLITEILDHRPAPTSHLADAILDLAQATESPDWSTMEDIDIPSDNGIYHIRSTRLPITLSLPLLPTLALEP